MLLGAAPTHPPEPLWRGHSLKPHSCPMGNCSTVAEKPQGEKPREQLIPSQLQCVPSKDRPGCPRRRTDHTCASVLSTDPPSCRSTGTVSPVLPCFSVVSELVSSWAPSSDLLLVPRSLAARLKRSSPTLKVLIHNLSAVRGNCRRSEKEATQKYPSDFLMAQAVKCCNNFPEAICQQHVGAARRL